MHHQPPHPHPAKEGSSSGAKLNRLRAAVLGASDGIVSISGLVVGVAGATTNLTIIVATGVAGVIAGAISMAAGEYVSVSSQRDAEQALLHKERKELDEFPEEELQELIGIYQGKGLSHATATTVAHELTKHDAWAAHVDAELGIDPNDLTNPWHAAIASALAFLLGAAIPMITIIAFPQSIRIGATFVAVMIALAINGYLSASLTGAPTGRAMFRVMLGGALAMVVTYGIGRLFGVSGI